MLPLLMIVELFTTQAVGMPRELVAQMRQAPWYFYHSSIRNP